MSTGLLMWLLTTALVLAIGGVANADDAKDGLSPVFTICTQQARGAIEQAGCLSQQRALQAVRLEQRYKVLMEIWILGHAWACRPHSAPGRRSANVMGRCNPA